MRIANETPARCPRCNWEPIPGENECASCGLVFAKWRATQPQRERAPIVVEPTPTVTLPRWIIPVAIILFIVAGIAWTKHHQSARQREIERMQHEELDEINQRGIEQRKNMDRHPPARK